MIKSPDGEGVITKQIMTELLFLNDHYMKEFDATILEVPSVNSLVLDRTAIYPRGGGQPSDRGWLEIEDGGPRFETLESSKENGKAVHQITSQISDLERSRLVGKKVRGTIDWDLRYKHMRHHTALHILSGVVYHQFQSRITGGQIYPDRARLDFTLSEMNREKLDLIESEVNRIVSMNADVRAFWIGTEEALQRSELYRLSADLLPKGLDKLRIVEIVGFDAQLDGGTHVAKTGEIGKIRISKTENKGKDNKRIEIVLDQH